MNIEPLNDNILSPEAKRQNDFREKVLHPLVENENHQQVSRKEDFTKMCKRWGKIWIDFIEGSYVVFKELIREGFGQPEQEFKDYVGIPDFYFKSLEKNWIDIRKKYEIYIW